ncbi:hypothetical protein DPMN_138002 [Dreissena polymorpha]|uniref:Uncharacterized protein n=1 Tax=Dreissena polymorpha TaxID=45954 RepID=A0A9D4G8Z1_DREPO|nr:hypothetical protein DPMN_138002 [Dreissena polymorpha]
MAGTLLRAEHLQKTFPPPDGHFNLDCTKNVTSRVLTKKSNTLFLSTGIVFKLVQDIIMTRVLTKFHKEWIINVNVDNTKGDARMTDKRPSQKHTMNTLCSVRSQLWESSSNRIIELVRGPGPMNTKVNYTLSW